MGREGKRGSGVVSGNQIAITLREEVSGKRHLKGGPASLRSVLKLQHLKKLAVWAGGEASIPSLGALFGHRLGAFAEAMGTPLDPSLLSCERCESILQPGHNCTVRVESNRTKLHRRHNKSGRSTKNNLVYTCHFCSHWNLKRGTPKGHMRDIYPSEPDRASVLKSVSSIPQKYASLEKSGDANKNMEERISLDLLANQTTEGEILIGKSPATPLVRSAFTLLDLKKRKRSRSGSKKPVGPESSPATIDNERAANALSKRKRKSWSSLKEIAENSLCEFTCHYMGQLDYAIGNLKAMFRYS